MLGYLAVDFKYLGCDISNEDIEKLRAYATLAGSVIRSAETHGSLARFMNEAAHAPGERGVLVAMGPAFCSEFVLFEW